MSITIPNNYNQAATFLGKYSSKNIKGKRETSLYRLDDTTIGLKYHHTTVVEFRMDGSIKINSGEWRSKTTKDRINQAIRGLGVVFQENWEWYLHNLQENRTVPFQNGMVINKLSAFA